MFDIYNTILAIVSFQIARGRGQLKFTCIQDIIAKHSQFHARIRIVNAWGCIKCNNYQLLTKFHARLRA